MKPKISIKLPKLWKNIQEPLTDFIESSQIFCLRELNLRGLKLAFHWIRVGSKKLNGIIKFDRMYKVMKKLLLTLGQNNSFFAGCVKNLQKGSTWRRVPVLHTYLLYFRFPFTWGIGQGWVHQAIGHAPRKNGNQWGFKGLQYVHVHIISLPSQFRCMEMVRAYYALNFEKGNGSNSRPAGRPFLVRRWLCVEM